MLRFVQHPPHPPVFTQTFHLKKKSKTTLPDLLLGQRGLCCPNFGWCFLSTLLSTTLSKGWRLWTRHRRSHFLLYKLTGPRLVGSILKFSELRQATRRTPLPGKHFQNNRPHRQARTCLLLCFFVSKRRRSTELQKIYNST